MKISALICWYDANPAWLCATIASLARIGVDRVVVSDGAYALFPDRRARSGMEQVEAIQMACDAVDLDLLMYRPGDSWLRGEQAKRDHMFKLATCDMTIGEDWLFVIDDDEVICEGSPGVVRERLGETDALAMTAACVQPSPSWLIPEESKVSVSGQIAPETTEIVESFRQRYPVPHWNGPWLQTRFFRVIEDMRCEVTHYTYTGVSNGVRYGLRSDLNGSNLGYPKAPTEHVEGVVIEHRDLLRPKIRREAKRDYYAKRDELRVESPEYHGRESVATDPATSSVV